MLNRLDERLRAMPLLASPGRVAVLAVAVAVALQLLAVSIYNNAARPIFELGFLFDPYLKALYEGKGYIGCEDFGCNRASRMPGIPVFLYALSFLTLKYKVAAYLKVALLGGATLISALLLARELRPATALARLLVGVIVLFVVFAPNLVKHMSALHYEEGYLVALVASVTMLALTLLLRGAERFSPALAAGALVLAGLCYLVKNSQIAVLAALTIIVVALAWRAGRPVAALVLLALALAAPAGWATHNALMTGRASFMSSYDGENLFRGFHPELPRVYPKCSPDVLFSTSDTCDGQKLNLPRESSRHGFSDEWAWHDSYRARAFAFLRDNPGATLSMLGKKALIVAAWPRLVPYIMEDNDGRERRRSVVEEVIGSAWIVAGRLIELFGLGLAGWLLVRGDGRARAVAASSLLLAGAYAAPYVIGFSVERHFSILILICALCTMALVSEWQRIRTA